MADIRRWGGFLAVLLSVVMAFALTAGHFPLTQAAPQPERVRVFIGFSKTPGASEEALVRAFGGDIRHTYHLIPAISAELPEPAVSNLLSRAEVTLIEPVIKAYHSGDYQTELDDTWGVKRVGAGTPHGDGYFGEGVKVAVIDSGIDYSHPEFSGIYKGGYDFAEDNEDPMDYSGHGTHVAGTIAAARDGVGVVGVSPGVEIYALKVFPDEGGAASYDDVVAAVEWAVDNEIQMTNNSYVSADDPGALVKNAFDNAYAAGVLHVAAAGNAGTIGGGGDNVEYPARWDSVIAVAASNKNDARASFSSTGPNVELIAPGVDILSTVPMAPYAEGIVVDGVDYEAQALLGSGIGSITGPLVDCGEGKVDDIPADLPAGDWIALIERRGNITFAEKVKNVMDAGAAAAVITNNDEGEPDDTGIFTLGAGTWIPAVSVSYNSGVGIRAGSLDEGTVTVTREGYATQSGTSMASPHAAGVAALVWSIDPNLTNLQIREVLQNTTEDLGLSWNHQGHGLVRADLAMASVMSLRLTLYGMDFGMVMAGRSATLEDVPILEVIGPNITHLSVSVSEIESEEGAPWSWGDGLDEDTVKLEITITDGPWTGTITISEAGEHVFFDGPSVPQGLYTGNVTLTAGPQKSAALSEQMSIVLAYIATVD